MPFGTIIMISLILILFIMLLFVFIEDRRKAKDAERKNGAEKRRKKEAKKAEDVNPIAENKSDNDGKAK